MPNPQPSPRCGGTGQISYHRDDPRGPEFNSAPDSMAGGGIHSCPGCPDCKPDPDPSSAQSEGRQRFHVDSIRCTQAFLGTVPAQWTIHAEAWHSAPPPCPGHLVPEADLQAVEQRLKEKEREADIRMDDSRVQWTRAETLAKVLTRLLREMEAAGFPHEHCDSCGPLRSARDEARETVALTHPNSEARSALGTGETEG